MSTPRAKPWESASGASAHVDATHEISTPLAAASAHSDIPERPTSLSDPQAALAMGYGNMGSSYNSGYGSGYGTGYNSAYGTSYGGGYGASRFGGGYGSSMFGGYGSSGLGYGGYGSLMYGGYGGYGGYGLSMYGSMYGQNGMNGMNGPGGIAEGTQATFQLIESIIGAVGGFAQMLEATYMATHSSFFTMVSLAEQFGNLKNTLGLLLGIFALIKFAKKLFYRLAGRKYNHGINLKEFGKFENKQKKLEDSIRRQQSGERRTPSISFKPLVLFLAASIGFPYLLSKAIHKLNEQQRLKQQRNFNDRPGMDPQMGPLDPESLEFAKALYEFNPENPNIEIELKPKELVAILSKLDPLGNESKWWKVRSRSGKVGYVPLNFLSIIERKIPLKQVEAAPNPILPPLTGQSTPKSFVEQFDQLH